MAGAQKLPTRITEITLSLAKPATEGEQKLAFTSVINALQGQYGQGTFDGGVAGDGYWCKYGYFFDWRLSVNITTAGSYTITSPFSSIDSSILVSYNNATPKTYIVSGNTFTVPLVTGVNIIESFFNRVGK